MHPVDVLVGIDLVERGLVVDLRRCRVLEQDRVHRRDPRSARAARRSPAPASRRRADAHSATRSRAPSPSPASYRRTRAGVVVTNQHRGQPRPVAGIDQRLDPPLELSQQRISHRRTGHENRAHRLFTLSTPIPLSRAEGLGRSGGITSERRADDASRRRRDRVRRTSWSEPPRRAERRWVGGVLRAGLAADGGPATTAGAGRKRPVQCRKWRSPVNTITRPSSSARLITRSSPTDPPGWITQATPASAAASTPSGNG